MRLRFLQAAATLSLSAFLLVGLGCTTKIPPPTPPPFAGEIIEINLGEVPLAEAARGSHAIAETVQLPRKAVLRIHGGYQTLEPKDYFPILAKIQRQSKGTLVTYSDGVTGDLKRGDTGYAFTVDIAAPESGSGEFDLLVTAGKKFVAQGKVAVKD